MIVVLCFTYHLSTRLTIFIFMCTFHPILAGGKTGPIHLVGLGVNRLTLCTLDVVAFLHANPKCKSHCDEELFARVMWCVFLAAAHVHCVSTFYHIGCSAFPMSAVYLFMENARPFLLCMSASADKSCRQKRKRYTFK